MSGGRVIDPNLLLVDALRAHLVAAYRRTYGSQEPEIPEIVAWATELALENVARTDAPYHDVRHTALVAQCGVEILRCRHLVEGGVAPRDWMHVVLSLLFHDIGYVRGVCRSDRPGAWRTGVDDGTVALAPGATDAALMRWHVDRGILFVRERFAGHPRIDADVIAANLDATRFPVPRGARTDPDSLPGVCRAADLIGQLGDPYYLNKLPALFSEMAESGLHEQVGFAHPDEMRARFPEFYERNVRPWVGEALGWLRVTAEGRRWIATLHDHVQQAARPLR